MRSTTTHSHFDGERTPTTKMVKHFFANGHRDRWFISYNERLAQFDRWITGLLTKTYSQGCADERARIIALLHDLDVIRRDALGDLVAFNTDGTEVIYLTGLEGETE